MATTNIQIRVDKALKASAEQLFSDIGLDMPSAIRLFLKQAVIKNGIPFSIERDLFHSTKNQEHLSEIISDLNQGKNCTVHELIEE